MWNLVSVYLETLLVLVKDRHTFFCAEHTIGSKLFWTHPMGFQGDVGHVQSRFDTYGDSVSVGAR